MDSGTFGDVIFEVMLGSTSDTADGRDVDDGRGVAGLVSGRQERDESDRGEEVTDARTEKK